MSKLKLSSWTKRVVRKMKKAGKPYSKQEVQNIEGSFREFTKKKKERPRFVYGSKARPRSSSLVNV
ncbi:MAG: hypothetical protein WC915_04030 [archaeon]|jgi:hypothetical protein